MQKQSLFLDQFWTIQKFATGDRPKTCGPRSRRRLESRGTMTREWKRKRKNKSKKLATRAMHQHLACLMSSLMRETRLVVFFKVPTGLDREPRKSIVFSYRGHRVVSSISLSPPYPSLATSSFVLSFCSWNVYKLNWMPKRWLWTLLYLQAATKIQVLTRSLENS